MEFDPSLALEETDATYNTMNIQENIDLKPLTYFKIGGRARYLVEVKDEEDLREAVAFAKTKKVPLLILGAASNVLVSDRGYNGFVIRMQIRDISCDGDLLTVGAGVPNAIAVSAALKESLAGFEWAAGIPGTIGGSVRGNAGCFSGDMSDVVEGVRYLNTKSGKIEEEDNTFCRFGYRESIFKTSPHFIIISARLRLRQDNSGLGQRMVRHYTSIRTDTQDIGISSAGCAFKNVLWPSNEARRKRLLSIVPQVAEFSTRETIPVGFLIDQLGLKGRAIGKVSISKKHGNYLINNGGATAEEVIMLIGLIKEYVHRKYDLQLEEEIQYVGFD
jgi:UDP-N-acetylmuramate dehydrogenase